MGVAIIAYSTGLLATLEGLSVDARFSVRGAERPPSNLVVVGVDAKTFDDLGLQWPFPRRVHAALINRIRKQHPAAIAFDVQFSEASRLPFTARSKLPFKAQPDFRDESPFVLAINSPHAKHRMVFSATETLINGDSRFLGHSANHLIKRGYGMRIGNGNYRVDPGGVIRRATYAIDGLGTFAVATAEVATHRTVPRSRFRGRTVYIDFYGPAGTVPYISYSTALLGRLRRDFFRGKVVVIGAVAPTLQDLHATSTDSLMPGPELQANTIATVLRGEPLTGAAGWINVLLIIGLSISVPLVSLRLGPLAATAFAVLLGGGFVLATQLAFNSGSVLTFVYPTLGLVLSGTGSLAVQLVTEAMERTRVRDIFTRFVPENVVDEVLASADGLRLGGVQREGTVMFSDLRGFTSLAESLTPAQVIETLNHYLSEMSDAILDHGGTLVAYMGDGIMAVFGAPLPQPDHADRALAAALEMRDVRLPRFNAWLREEGLSHGFRMGIGLNSGQVMSGQVGSERRVEYTAVGDTTNSASRIEGMTKGTPHQLLLAESTKDALVNPADNLIFFQQADIRGRIALIKLWTVPEREPACGR